MLAVEGDVCEGLIVGHEAPISRWYQSGTLLEDFLVRGFSRRLRLSGECDDT
jgi:hypothetical protein